MQTLRTLEALEREGLVANDPRLAAAAEAMAIAVTPEMLALVDRSDPVTLSTMKIKVLGRTTSRKAGSVITAR